MSLDLPLEYVNALAKRHFAIKERIGGGAYGTVYRAIQSNLGRPVAIKFFDNPFTKGSANRKRFDREAPLLARVEHPSIPYVITTGSVQMRDGQTTPYTIMQFVSGNSLQKRIDTRIPFESEHLRKVMSDVLLALVEAHKNDVVHRDVKPDNIILAEHRTFLIDFSIGIVITPKPGSGLSRATAPGERVGTPDYAAPEQREDSSTVTHLADLYSAGVVLAQMLGARVPLRLDILDIELSKVPDALRDVIRRAAAEKPSDRYASALDFLVGLEAAMQESRARDTESSGGNIDNIDNIDNKSLTDTDALLLGVITSACRFPGGHTSDSHIESVVQHTLSGLDMAMSYRRLIRNGFVEVYYESEAYGEYQALRLTEAGEIWTEMHQARISALLGMVKPPPANPITSVNVHDDIPF